VTLGKNPGHGLCNDEGRYAEFGLAIGHPARYEWDGSPVSITSGENGYGPLRNNKVGHVHRQAEDEKSMYGSVPTKMISWSAAQCRILHAVSVARFASVGLGGGGGLGKTIVMLEDVTLSPSVKQVHVQAAGSSNGIKTPVGNGSDISLVVPRNTLKEGTTGNSTPMLNRIVPENTG